MSPALQRLAEQDASKYTDRALRAGPHPSARRSATSTPRQRAPDLDEHTSPCPATRTSASQDPACITDNLLQLPARRKASDFF